MDYDGDSVSIKPILIKDGVEKVKEIQLNPIFNYNYVGEFKRGIGRDGVQTMFTFTRDIKPEDKSKTINPKHDFVVYLLSKSPLDLKVLYTYCASFDPNKKPELSLYDKVSVTLPNKKKVDTTIGRLVINKAFFSHVWDNPQFDYINEVMYENNFKHGLKNVLFMQIYGKVPKDSVNETIVKYNEFILRASTVFNSSCTYEMLNPDKEFQEYRDSVINPVEKEIKENNDISLLEKKEKQIIDFAKKKFKNDDMYELYESKNKASWENDFKAMFIGMGSLPGIGGKSTIITRPLSDGMRIEDIPALVRVGAMGAYARGCKTADAGALYKFFSNSFTNVRGKRGDCGNRHTIEVEVTSKYDDVLGKYMVDKNGKSTLITLDNIEKLIGKTIHIPDPMFCKSKGDTYCSHCIGELVFDIMGRDDIPLGSLIAEVATGILNMYMKQTHSLVLSVFTIDDLNNFILPKSDFFETKVDPIDGQTKIYTKKKLIWRIPALSVESVDSEYHVMAHGSILEDETGNKYTMVLGTEVSTVPSESINPDDKEDGIYKHYQFIYYPGDVIFTKNSFLKKEDNVYKMIKLFLSGNVSNLIPVQYHLNTLLNTLKTNKKINASLLSYNIMISTLARDADNIYKPARETGNERYKMVSSNDLVEVLGGTFEALFAGDVNRGLFITTSKTDKEQSKRTSDIEKAFYY